MKMDELIQAGEPVIGFEVAAGQFEYVDENGVSTGPIVSIGFITRDHEYHRFTVLPEAALGLAPVITDASRSALSTYHKQDARRARRHLILTLALVGAMFVLVGVFAGWEAAHAARAKGDTITGVFAGIDTLFQMIGMGAVAYAAIRLKNRPRHKKVAAE